MKKIKTNTLRGVAGTLIAVGTLIGFANVLANENAGQINSFLGVKGETNNVTEDTNYYPSDYNSLEEMRVAEKANDIKTQEEGSVLFYNNNNALPLNTEKKITLFGRTSVDPIYRGGSGGSATTGAEAVSLKTALEEVGFEINPTVYNALSNSGVARDRGNIGEVDGSFYNSLSSSYGDYSDAAIIVLGRYGGEQQDMTAGGGNGADNLTDENGYPVDTEDVSMLSLHESERSTIQAVKNSNKFNKIIVLLNTGYPMDIGELEGLGVDAVLWCGFPGYTGFNGVANVIKGLADPSGRSVDTYATNSYSSPAVQNYGSFSFTNDPDTHYVVYAEGIYTGYKYYETRYYDSIKNRFNATSEAGTFASEGNWNYADEMVYTFGSGISYASFTQELTSLEWNQDAHVVTAEVKVTNNGSETYNGKSKSVVELYVSLPYEEGQAEKSAIQLIGYGKTKDLAKGESETVTITVDDYLFATYDEEATNGADSTKTGCYVFDAGDYKFAIGDNAHDAINNVLAFEGATGLYDEKGNNVTGDANKVSSINLESYDNVTYAKSRQTGEVVSNRFDDIDVNYWLKDSVTYLTRSDWNTFPHRITGLTATDEMISIMSGHFYEKPADAPEYTDFEYSQDNGINFIEMKDVPYDDPKWEEFIDQLSPSDLSVIVGEHFGNYAIESVNSPESYNADGPDGIQNNPGFSHVCSTIVASTFNNELIANKGKFMAEDGYYSGQSGVYGFGANQHRTPFGGRAYEYWSEDQIHSYLVGSVATKAAQEKGLITYNKHFCANDQEVWRNGCTFMEEQTYRLGALKAFEGSFTEGGSLGTMTSNARVGLKVVATDKNTMTGVLKDEWGFKGVAMTDSSRGAQALYTQEAIDAGIDQFNNDTQRAQELKNYLIKDKDGHMRERSREIAKHYFYMLLRTFEINGMDETTTTSNTLQGWQIGMYVVDGVIGTLAIAAIGLYTLSYINDLKKNKEVKAND